MPKETIYNSNFPNDKTFNVEVGWTRDLDVQLGIKEANDRSMWWVYGEDYLGEIGLRTRKDIEDGIEIDEFEIKNAIGQKCLSQETTRPLTDAEIGRAILNTLDTVCGCYDSLWATMNRKEINDLIRVLRRARDAAYGRDE